MDKTIFTYIEKILNKKIVYITFGYTSIRNNKIIKENEEEKEIWTASFIGLTNEGILLINTEFSKENLNTNIFPRKLNEIDSSTSDVILRYEYLDSINLACQENGSESENKNYIIKLELSGSFANKTNFIKNVNGELSINKELTIISAFAENLIERIINFKSTYDFINYFTYNEKIKILYNIKLGELCEEGAEYYKIIKKNKSNYKNVRQIETDNSSFVKLLFVIPNDDDKLSCNVNKLSDYKFIMNYSNSTSLFGRITVDITPEREYNYPILDSNSNNLETISFNILEELKNANNFTYSIITKGHVNKLLSFHDDFISNEMYEIEVLTKYKDADIINIVKNSILMY